MEYEFSTQLWWELGSLKDLAPRLLTSCKLGLSGSHLAIRLPGGLPRSWAGKLAGNQGGFPQNAALFPVEFHQDLSHKHFNFDKKNILLKLFLTSSRDLSLMINLVSLVKLKMLVFYGSTCKERQNIPKSFPAYRTPDDSDLTIVKCC